MSNTALPPATVLALEAEPRVEQAPTSSETVCEDEAQAAPATTEPEPPWTTPPTGSLAPAVAVDPLVITLPRENLSHDFSGGPFYFTAAFDGSLRFALWLRELGVGRAMKQKHGKTAHLTFFVNSAFYTTRPGKSDIGRALSQNEVLVRRALTQQAINEGHDIGDHGMGHHDGRNWTKAQWLEELDRFHGTMDRKLFEPIPREGGGFEFPRFEPLAGAEPGQTGARCAAASECSSGSCIFVTEQLGVCSQPCNHKLPCPTGTTCGAPSFRDDTDVCVPLPVFPVVLDGKTLFNEKGEPNLKHPRLTPYRIVGFRAPYLAANDALYEALAERGYQYDTSQSAMPGPPFFLHTQDHSKKVLEFGLMLFQGGLTIPMDYNYSKLKATGERMASDYRSAILAAYELGRIPWNVGHHFALWEDGAYLRVLESMIDLVLSDCPDEDGQKRCEGGQVVSFRELARRVQGH